MQTKETTMVEQRVSLFLLVRWRAVFAAGRVTGAGILVDLTEYFTGGPSEDHRHRECRIISYLISQGCRQLTYHRVSTRFDEFVSQLEYVVRYAGLSGIRRNVIVGDISKPIKNAAQTSCMTAFQ